MQPTTPPKIAAVEVIASQPTDSDRIVLSQLSAQSDEHLPDVAHIVKIKFESIPPVASQGWALYVDNERIPKYWAYKEGIYFKVFDPSFFSVHNGHMLRFSIDGVNFVDTGKKLTKPNAFLSTDTATKMPLQSEVLK